MTHPGDTPDPEPTGEPGGLPREEEAQAAPRSDGEGISGVDNWIEEGGPLEPQELVDDGPVGPASTDRESIEGGLPQPSELEFANTALAERTADLQRLQAEFLNYKRRVDRDRELIAQNASYKVLSPIIEVLDTIDRAREHGEIGEGLRTVADQLERVVTQLGLTKFGAVGDAFDPTLHEALSHLGEDADVEVITCRLVAKSGYKIGERVVRAAQVVVVDPPRADVPDTSEG